MKAILSGAAALAVVAMGASARAQFVPILDFEGPELTGAADGGEALGTNNGGVVSNTYGVTSGANALFFNDKAISGSGTIFDIGTVNGSSLNPEVLSNFAAFQAASAAIVAGTAVRLEFDVTYDAVTFAASPFVQLGVFINSDAGFDGLGFGGLIGGDVTTTPAPGGEFPALGNEGATGGVTFTTLDPSNFAAGDNHGAVRVSIPVGPSAVLLFGPGADPTLDFAQFGFTQNGGGTVLDLGFDRVGFQIGAVPEPTTLTALAGAASLVLRRSRRRA